MLPRPPSRVGQPSSGLKAPLEDTENRHMTALSRLLTLLALTLLAASPAAALADDDDGKHPPVVTTLAATQVGMTSARLNATVSPAGHATIYDFEYGPTTAYGKRTTIAAAGDDKSPVPVSADVSGLAARTTYHFRLVATNKDGTTRGADGSFTTSAPATPPAATPGGQPAAGSNTGEPSTDHADEPAGAGGFDTTSPKPVLGRKVLVGEVSGSILVRLPGARSAVPLDADAGVPVGSVVDARDGVVELSSVVEGTTQSGRFWGAVFQVRQSRSGNGMTDLVLRGGRPEGCGRREGSARAAAVADKRRPRKGLWGKDKGGRFRTHGRNSVATVRGTTWLVEERCEGTLTRVTEGAVVVRDVRRGRSVTVRAGGRYLARDGRSARG
jgi:hypothetical protein